MGKQRRQRTSFHISPKKTPPKPTSNNEEKKIDQSMDSPLNFTVSDSLFANLNINLNQSLKQQESNKDTRSVKSHKSVKFEEKSKNSIATSEKTLKKKDKLKVRRELLLQKIDVVNQKKKEEKLRKKRKNISVIGDTNPLHDALPSLESLLTRTKQIPIQIEKQNSTKGVQKAAKRQKDAIKNVQLFKAITKNKKFNANPFGAITQHIKAIVEEEKLKSKQSTYK